MNRQDYNKAILTCLKDKKFLESFYSDYHSSQLYERLNDCIEQYPDQRFGQIFTNYIYPDYRTRNDIVMNSVMDMLFYNVKCDPFNEESESTCKRLAPEYGLYEYDYKSEDYDKLYEIWDSEKADLL